MSILQLLSSDNFITVNRTAAKIVGLDAAVILGELASEALYWQQHRPDFDGWFYSTVENLEERTFLSAHSQRQAIQRLQDQGWIRTEKKGMPAKRYISINEEEIEKSLHDKSLKFLTTSNQKTERQDVKIFNTNKNINNKNIEKEKREDIQPADPEEKSQSLNDNKVTRKDIGRIIDLLLEAYPYNKKKITKETTAEIWLEAFSGEDADKLYKAVRNHIKTKKFYPAITEIEEQLRRIYLTDIPEKPASAPERSDSSEDISDDFFAQFED